MPSPLTPRNSPQRSINLTPIPAAMDAKLPDGMLGNTSARLILNMINGKRMAGLVVRGRHDPAFMNQDLHDQLLGAVCSQNGRVCTGVPVIQSNPISQTAYVGQTVRMSVGVSSALPVTYQWFRNGTAVPSSNSSSIVVSIVDLSSGGDFRVIVTNEDGIAISDLATITVVNRFNLIYGKSTLPTFGTSTIATLAQVLVSSVAGNRSISDGPGYVYFAYPSSAPALTVVAIDPMPMVMADSSKGYDQTANGIPFALVTVDGTEYRVYRSFYKLNGALTIRLG